MGVESEIGIGRNGRTGEMEMQIRLVSFRTKWSIRIQEAARLPPMGGNKVLSVAENSQIHNHIDEDHLVEAISVLSELSIYSGNHQLIGNKYTNMVEEDGSPTITNASKIREIHRTSGGEIPKSEQKQVIKRNETITERDANKEKELIDNYDLSGNYGAEGENA